MLTKPVSTANFAEHELVCSCCGRPNLNPEFEELMKDVQKLREWYGKPMIITSAYRCVDHPIEAKKIAAGRSAGEHNRSAVDFQVPVEDCHKIVKKAFEMGFTGIGINLTGSYSQRFIHLDKRTTGERIWSY